MASNNWKTWRDTLLEMPVFNDNVDRTMEKISGIYVIGTTTFNPNTNEKYYWVKAGRSSNLNQRFISYRTANPAIYPIAWEEHDPTDLGEYERYFQLVLMDVAIAKSSFSNEWFLLDETTYKEICAKGCNWFYGNLKER